MAKPAFRTAASTPKEHQVLAPRRHLRRAREQRIKPTLTVFGPPAAEPAQSDGPMPDPVRIAVLAMESLGRASMRASFTGTEVQVTVPDASTAAVFNAALVETVQRRPTDRLIRVVIG
jgi:hypothetical protein